MNDSLLLQEIRSRLIHQSHSLLSLDDNICSLDVCPSPNDIVTVATITDGFLNAPYRNRYYVFIDHSIAFLDIINNNLTINKQCNNKNLFLKGPVRWLLHRLSFLDQILLWPPTRYHQPNGTWLFHPWELDKFSVLLEKLQSLTPASVGGLILDPKRLLDQNILLECCLSVATGYRDFFLSDIDCRIVYVLHHHDMVEVSAPITEVQQSIIADLDGFAPQIQNCSNY
jgi:hypothetical protein